MAYLSTCHLELVVWDGNLVKSMYWEVYRFIIHDKIVYGLKVGNPQRRKGTILLNWKVKCSNHEKLICGHYHLSERCVVFSTLPSIAIKITCF